MHGASADRDAARWKRGGWVGRHRYIAFATALLFVVAAGCGREARSPASSSDHAGDVLHIVASLPPEAYFVERVAGDRAQVETLVSPGQSPHTYEPTPRQIAMIESASVFFRTGMPFENALAPKLAEAMPNLRIVDLREGLTLRDMEDHEGHGSHQDADEGGKDPHIWMDPVQVKIQAETIANVLCDLCPADAESFRTNLLAFDADLDRLDADVRHLLGPYAGSRVLVYHPAYGYFTDRYGLVEVPIEIEGKEPTGRELSETISLAQGIGARVVFTQPEFAQGPAMAVAQEIGARTVPLSVLDHDYLECIRRVAEGMAQALAQ